MQKKKEKKAEIASYLALAKVAARVQLDVGIVCIRGLIIKMKGKLACSVRVG